MAEPKTQTKEQEQPQTKTIYLAMADAHESMIAKKWAAANKRRFVTTIPIEKLTPDMVIVPVVRPIDRTPMHYEEFDPIRHAKIRKERRPEELVSEMQECAPVPVGSYWTGGRDRIVVDDFTELLNGQLDVAGFLDALARSAGAHEVWPRTHHGTENKNVVLTWGA